MIEFDSYFLNGLKPPTSIQFCLEFDLLNMRFPFLVSLMGPAIGVDDMSP